MRAGQRHFSRAMLRWRTAAPEATRISYNPGNLSVALLQRFAFVRTLESIEAAQAEAAELSDDLILGLHERVGQNAANVKQAAARAAVATTTPTKRTRAKRRAKGSSDDATEPSETAKRRQAAVVLRDDFWDDDEAAGQVGRGTAERADPQEIPPTSTRRRRSRSKSGTPTRPPPADAALAFSIDSLVEAAEATSAGMADGSSNRLHGFASAKGLHQTSVEAAVATLAKRMAAASGEEDLVFVAAVHKVCLYYASRGSVMGHARMLLILAKAAILAAPMLSANIAKLQNTAESSSVAESVVISTHAATIVATLYEAFVRPALLPVKKGGKAKLVAALLDDCAAAQRELATLLLPCIVQCATSLSFNASVATDDRASHSGDTLVVLLQRLHHRVSFLDVAASIVPLATLDTQAARLQTMQLVSKGRSVTYEALLACVKEILMPHTTMEGPSDEAGTSLDAQRLAACFELAADRLQTWSPTDREHVRVFIGRKFVAYCESLLSQGDAAAKPLVAFMDHAVLDTRTMAALRRVAHESAPCYDVVAREILSCATVVMSLMAPQNDAAGRLAFVKHYVQRLVSSGLPLRTLFASQFCIGLTAPELLAIVRLHRSSASLSGAIGAIPPTVVGSAQGTTTAQSNHAAMPEILTRTLLSHVSSRIAKLRLLSSELEASAFHQLPEVEDCSQDCVELMAEFALLQMHQECVTVAQHLATLWQLLDKHRRDPLESFLSRANALLLFRAILEQDARGECLPRASVNPVGEAWTLLTSKLCDTVGLLTSGSMQLVMDSSATPNGQVDPEHVEIAATSSQRIAMDSLIALVAMSSAVGQAGSSTVSQLTKHFATLCAHASHEAFCGVLRKLASAMNAAVRVFVAEDLTRCQSSSRLYQAVLQELLRAHRGFSEDATLVAQGASWSRQWDNVAAVVAALRPLCCDSIQMESECAELMVFRTEQLSQILADHLSSTVSFSSKELLAIAEVMYLRRTAHVVTDNFDKRFTNALVVLFQRDPLSLQDASNGIDALALSTVMLQKGSEQAIERWLTRCEAALSVAAETLKTVSLVQLLRCTALHSVGSAHRVTPVVRRQLLPLLEERLPDASLPLVVESLRSLSHLGIGEVPVMAVMVRRILTEISQLRLGDCGDVAGLVPMLIDGGHDAALSLPAALAERAIEKRLSAEASDVSRLVRGFSALSGPEHAPLRAKVLNGLILRCMHVAASMAPEELLATLEGYLAIKSSHMSLMGVVLARISDSKDAFPLPLTIRLVSVSLDAAQYDARVSKACVTAAQPVFLALTQHLLKNDVMSLVGTANHAELILNCLSSAFSKEPIADDVIRAVAQHCTHVPPAGILAALRLIALRGSADFNAANVLFQHCLTEIVPHSSPLQLAQTALQLVRCGIRTGTLFVAVDKRLLEVATNCNATALACLCEAHLLARRDDASVLCRVLCDRCTVSTSDGGSATSGVLAEMTLAEMRLAIVVLVSSTLTIPEEHIQVLRCILERISSERIQLRTATLDVIDALQALQQLVKIIPYSSNNASSATSVHTTVLRDAAEVLATATLPSLPLITGHAAQQPDLSKTVDFALCLAKLQLCGHTGTMVALRTLLANGDAVKQRHVLKTKVEAIASLRPDDGLAQDAAELLDELAIWLRGISDAEQSPSGEASRAAQPPNVALGDALALE